MNGSDVQALWAKFVEELGRAGAEELLRAAMTWGAIGAAAGLGFCLLAYFGFRSLGWYRCATTGGRWMKRIVVVLSSGVVIMCGGLAGVGEGIQRSAGPVIQNSPLGREKLPELADFAATTCAWLDLAGEVRGDPSDADVATRLEAFRSGRWDLDVPRFFDRIQALRTDVFTEILLRIEVSIHAQAPALRGGAAGRALHAALHRFGPALLDQRFANEMETRGLEPLRLAIRDKLLAEAARRGNPTTIEFREFSDFLLREAILPVCLNPIRTFVRNQQVVLALVSLFVCVVPAGVCRLARGKAASAATPIPDPQPVRADRT